MKRGRFMKRPYSGDAEESVGVDALGRPGHEFVLTNLRAVGGAGPYGSGLDCSCRGGPCANTHKRVLKQKCLGNCLAGLGTRAGYN